MSFNPLDLKHLNLQYDKGNSYILYIRKRANIQQNIVLNLHLSDLSTFILSMLSFQWQIEKNPFQKLCMNTDMALFWANAGTGSRGVVIKSCMILVTPWTVAHQAALSMGFPRQEYWRMGSHSFPRGSSRPRDWTWLSCNLGRFSTNWATRKAPNVGIAACYLVCADKWLSFSTHLYKGSWFPEYGWFPKRRIFFENVKIEEISETLLAHW